MRTDCLSRSQEDSTSVRRIGGHDLVLVAQDRPEWPAQTVSQLDPHAATNRVVGVHPLLGPVHRHGRWEPQQAERCRLPVGGLDTQLLARVATLQREGAAGAEDAELGPGAGDQELPLRVPSAAERQSTGRPFADPQHDPPAPAASLAGDGLEIHRVEDPQTEQAPLDLELAFGPEDLAASSASPPSRPRSAGCAAGRQMTIRPTTLRSPACASRRTSQPPSHSGGSPRPWRRGSRPRGEQPAGSPASRPRRAGSRAHRCAR